MEINEPADAAATPPTAEKGDVVVELGRDHHPPATSGQKPGKNITLYRGEGSHDRPSYYRGPQAADAGGWWTTSLDSARRYAAGTPEGTVYEIEVDESEAEPRGLPGYFFIPDPKVRARRRPCVAGS